MDEEKTLQQAQENMKAINQAVESYQQGDMSADEAGAICTSDYSASASA